MVAEDALRRAIFPPSDISVSTLPEIIDYVSKAAPTVPMMPWGGIDWTTQDTQCLAGYIGLAGAGVGVAISGGAAAPIALAVITGGSATVAMYFDGCF